MKKYLLTGLAAFALFAWGCSEKENDFDSKIGQTGSDGLTGYITLTLDQNTKSRTQPHAGIEAGVGAENTVSNVTIVFTDDQGTITGFESGVTFTPVTGNTGTTEKIKIATGTYNVFALVNVPSEVSVALNQNINRVITVAAEADATKGFKNESFFMVNQRNSDTGTGGVSVAVASSNTIDNPAVAAVSVDRVAVKIADKTGASVTLAQSLQDLGIASVEVTGFVPLNVNKQFNMIQQWGDANVNNPALPQLTEKVLYTPVYTNVANLANQFFCPVTKYTTITATEITDLTTAPQYVKQVYATENRPTIYVNATAPILTSGMGETTGVIYRVQAKVNATDNMPTFYAFNGVVYKTLAEVQELPSFKDIVVLDGMSNPALRGRGIQVYESGVMYYTYFVRDPNTNYQYDSENYYGVFRNSVYNLAIGSLNKLGDDVPGGTKVTPDDPNPKIDTDDTYLTVNLTVNDWVLNEITIDF